MLLKPYVVVFMPLEALTSWIGGPSDCSKRYENIIYIGR